MVKTPSRSALKGVVLPYSTVGQIPEPFYSVKLLKHFSVTPKISWSQIFVYKRENGKEQHHGKRETLYYIHVQPKNRTTKNAPLPILFF